jgi:hypothetical protein
MTTAYTSLLGLALPVNGELTGTWGQVVNNYITTYLDGAIAGTQIISGSQTAVTLSKTTGTALIQVGSGATGSSQYQVIKCSGAPASLLTVTVPSAEKTYLVINATSTSQSVKIVGASGTGVTITSGKTSIVAWNGSDFVEISPSTATTATNLASGSAGTIPYQSASGTTAMLAAGTATYVLTANGAAPPSWQPPSTSGGTVTSVAALTLGTTGTDVSSSVLNPSTTPVITLNIPTASASNRGALSSSDWTTFNSKYTVGSALGTPSSGTLSSCTVDGTDAVGFRNVPINSQSANYPTVLVDSGKCILHPSTDANSRTFTIDGSISYPVGTAISFVNMSSQNLIIAITSNTMNLAGTGTTGSRILIQYGSATALKINPNTWIISGVGLS